MRGYILLLLIITVTSCNPDSQKKSVSTTLKNIDSDYEWIKGDICECYLVYGYPANIINDNCVFLSGQVNFKDLLAYMEADENILLLDSLKSLIFDNYRDKQRRFKADCLKRVRSYPVLKAYGEFQNESLWNQELSHIAHKSILSRVFEIRSTQLDKHHMVSIKNQIPGSLSTPTEEKVSIIYIDFVAQSFYVDYVSSQIDSPTIKYLDALSLSLMNDSMLNDSLVSLTYPELVY